MKIHGDTNSGNCLKVKWVCDRLALPYTWVAVDTLRGETRTGQFLKLNHAGQVPAVEFDGKEDIGGLRAAVGDEGLVSRALEVWVVQVDVGVTMSGRR